MDSIITELKKRHPVLAAHLALAMQVTSGLDCDRAVPIYKELEDKRNKDMRFNKLANYAETLFGKPRQRGTSHKVYPLPWQDLVTIQNDKGKAKRYQVKQVTKAAERLLALKCGIGDAPSMQASEMNSAHFTYKVLKDGSDYVGVVNQLPGLSWVADSKENALTGVKQLVENLF